MRQFLFHLKLHVCWRTHVNEHTFKIVCVACAKLKTVNKNEIIHKTSVWQILAMKPFVSVRHQLNKFNIRDYNERSLYSTTITDIIRVITIFFVLIARGKQHLHCCRRHFSLSNIWQINISLQLLGLVLHEIWLQFFSIHFTSQLHPYKYPMIQKQ